MPGNSVQERSRDWQSVLDNLERNLIFGSKAQIPMDAKLKTRPRLREIHARS
jgi:hypothetical protein